MRVAQSVLGLAVIVAAIFAYTYVLIEVEEENVALRKELQVLEETCEGK